MVPRNRTTKRLDRSLLVQLLLMAVGAFAFSFALVPLYDVFCEITGLGGKTNTTAAMVTEEPDVERWVTVEFLASVNEHAPWKFSPVVKTMQVHPGKLYDAEFFAQNLTQDTLTGQAVPSVAPMQASKYFKKTECFCFTSQRFTPGEGRNMPLRFIVDRDLPDYVDTISLSYTFFETERLASSIDQTPQQIATQ